MSVASPMWKFLAWSGRMSQQSTSLCVLGHACRISMCHQRHAQTCRVEVLTHFDNNHRSISRIIVWACLPVLGIYLLEYKFSYTTYSLLSIGFWFVVLETIRNPKTNQNKYYKTIFSCGYRNAVDNNLPVRFIFVCLLST